jgi:2-polyprenyl-3-methyl-5-hydroxy-6-metoxy-1,4-benzoquinol methylase
MMTTPDNKVSGRFDAASVRESWDRAAASFDRAQASGLDYYRLDFFGPAQIALCGNVRDMTLVDVACGSGYFARAMAEAGARVTGIDISPRMIALAERYEVEAPLGITYRVGDAADIASHVDPESFDMATSCMALQDMPTWPQSCEECTALCARVRDSWHRSRIPAATCRSGGGSEMNGDKSGGCV